MSAAMTREEREAFLAGIHVGVISVERPDRAPLTVPVWYHYTPGGEVYFVTGSSQRKTQALREAVREPMTWVDRLGSACFSSRSPNYSLPGR